MVLLCKNKIFYCKLLLIRIFLNSQFSVFKLQRKKLPIKFAICNNLSMLSKSLCHLIPDNNHCKNV